MSPVQVNKIQSLTGHKGALYTLCEVDDSRFLSAGGDGMLVLWDIKQPEVGQMIAKVPSTIYSVDYHTERKLAVIGQNFSGIHLVSLEDKQEVGSLQLTDQAIFDIQTNNERIYIVTGGGELIRVDWELNIHYRVQLAARSLRSISQLAQRDQLAIGSSDHSIKIVKASTGAMLKQFRAHENSVFTTVYHPELPILMSAGRDARIKFWDLDNDFAPIEEIVAHMYTINHLAFSPDRQHFISCSMDKSVKVWDAHTFKLLKVIDKARHAGHGTSVNKLLWLNHEETIVSCSDDQTISLWNINFTR